MSVNGSSSSTAAAAAAYTTHESVGFIDDDDVVAAAAFFDDRDETNTERDRERLTEKRKTGNSKSHPCALHPRPGR